MNRIVRASAFLSFAIASTNAAAQSAPTPPVAPAPAPKTAEERATVDAFRRGKDEEKKGHFEEARAAYLQAFALDPEAWGALWRLAKMDRKTGHAVDALKHLRIWLRNSHLDRQAQPSDREAALTWIDGLVKETGHFTFEDEWPSSVLIDGLPASPLRDDATGADVFDVTSGHHSVEARLGERMLKRELDLRPGTLLKLRFEPVVRAPQPPTDIPPVPAHEAEVVPAAVPEHPVDSTRVWGTIGVGVGAAALLTTGVAFALSANSAKGEAEKLRVSLSSTGCTMSVAPDCTRLQDLSGRWNTHQSLSVVFYGLGAAAAVGTAVVWFVLRAKPENRIGITPIVTPQTVGAQWTQTF